VDQLCQFWAQRSHCSQLAESRIQSQHHLTLNLWHSTTNWLSFVDIRLLSLSKYVAILTSSSKFGWLVGDRGCLQSFLIFALLNTLQSLSIKGVLLVHNQKSKDDVSQFQFLYSSAVVRCLMSWPGVTRKFGLRIDLLNTSSPLSHQLWEVFVKLYNKKFQVLDSFQFHKKMLFGELFMNLSARVK